MTEPNIIETSNEAPVVLPEPPSVVNEEITTVGVDLTPPKPKRSKLILLAIVGLIVAISVPAAVFLIKSRGVGDTRQLAQAPQCSQGKGGGCGNASDCCDWEVYQNGCCISKAGCSQDSDCGVGKKCNNGVCEGSSWNPQCGGSENQCTCGSTEKQCRGGKNYFCGNDCCYHDEGTPCTTSVTCNNWGKTCDPGFSCQDKSTGPECVTNAQLTPTGKLYSKCSDYQLNNGVKLIDDSSCRADPNCSKPGQDGICCKNTDSTYSYCCYRDGNCYTGGQSGLCKDNGNGSVTITNNGTAESTYTVITNDCSTTPKCPCSLNPVTTTEKIPAMSSRTFAIAGNKCGQVDVKYYCGSCKINGCGGQGGTPTPPTTPTPGSYTMACQAITVYNDAWAVISDLSTIKTGQIIYLATSGSTNQPQNITKGRIRINGGAWQETTATHNGKFYIQYRVETAGSYAIESMVYNPVLGWR